MSVLVSLHHLTKIKNPVFKAADQGSELEIAEFMSSFNI
jgi:hypothetical protein